MDLLSNLSLGFATAFTLQNLLYCFIGVTLGTLIGVLPGLGPVATIAMLLPATYALPPIAALIMLAGIYYGAQYGGSTTAILINIPGESSSVVTAIDGYQMAMFPVEDEAFGASGALVQGDVYKPSTEGCFLYFGVESIDETIARALANGGSELYAKKSNGELGWVAEIGDTEGNRIALHQPAS